MIKLLAPQGILAYSAEEFKTYVRTLYYKKEKRAPAIRLKKQKPPFVWKITKTGKLSLRFNRSDKWLSREEIDLIAQESGLPANEVWLHVLKKKIRISTAADEENINEPLPW